MICTRCAGNFSWKEEEFPLKRYLVRIVAEIVVTPIRSAPHQMMQIEALNQVSAPLQQRYGQANVKVVVEKPQKIEG